MPHLSSRWTIFLSILSLATVSIAQPLFELLGRYPEFLVVHGFDNIDLLAFAILVVGLPGISCWIFVKFFQLAIPKLYKFAYGLCTFMLFSLLLIPILSRLEISNGWFVLIGAQGAPPAPSVTAFRSCQDQRSQKNSGKFEDTEAPVV
jgi:hypothetical protein